MLESTPRPPAGSVRQLTASRMPAAPMNLSILYRGPLSSCNYGCPYCPFAKHAETDEEHATDRRALERFLVWVEGRPQDRLSVFFTPWGEALIRKRYQQALVRLTG